jgi:hypothetical protein
MVVMSFIVQAPAYFALWSVTAKKSFMELTPVATRFEAEEAAEVEGEEEKECAPCFHGPLLSSPLSDRQT